MMLTVEKVDDVKRDFLSVAIGIVKDIIRQQKDCIYELFPELKQKDKTMSDTLVEKEMME